MLKENDKSQEADTIERNIVRAGVAYDYRALEKFSLAWRKPGWRVSQEETNFGISAFQVGIALLCIVKWEDMCSLPYSDSLDAWIASLKEAQQPLVRKLFSADPFRDLGTLDRTGYQGYYDYAFVLNDLGNKNVVIQALEHSLRIEANHQVAA